MPDDVIAAGSWAFLDWTTPIDDPAAVAFQVAQLTAGMAVLKRELEQLREKDHGG